MLSRLAICERTFLNCVFSSKQFMSMAQPKSISRMEGTWVLGSGLKTNQNSEIKHSKCNHFPLHFHEQKVVRFDVGMNDLVRVQMIHNVEDLAAKVHDHALVHHLVC